MDDGVVGRLLGGGSCAGVGGVPSANSDEERKEPRVWGRRAERQALGSNRDGVLRGDGSSRSSVANCQLQLNEPRQGRIVRSVQVHAAQLSQPCPSRREGLMNPFT